MVHRELEPHRAEFRRAEPELQRAAAFLSGVDRAGDAADEAGRVDVVRGLGCGRRDGCRVRRCAVRSSRANEERMPVLGCDGSVVLAWRSMSVAAVLDVAPRRRLCVHVGDDRCGRGRRQTSGRLARTFASASTAASLERESMRRGRFLVALLGGIGPAAAVEALAVVDATLLRASLLRAAGRVMCRRDFLRQPGPSAFVCGPPVAIALRPW